MDKLSLGNERLLTGIKNNEDASVFLINDELALVQTLDFITPVVDDPFLYGQIAAANSLSDIFAMGARVTNALNIVGFDSCNFDTGVLDEIMQGGLDKVKECGGVIVGGHSVQTTEMYYGLSVLGVCHPLKFWANNTAKIGDVLILTKPLGTGVLSTCIKADMLNESQIKEAVDVMSRLNYYAVDAMCDISVNACTDVTGFGFLGHLSEMGRDDISFEIFEKEVPVIQSAKDMADMGFVPAGSYKNRDFCSKFVNKDVDILFFDAQTSGGLILAVSEKDCKKALQRLIDCGYEDSRIIGVVKQRKNRLIDIV
ncbi:selenide, water dikinase SelD [Campylobacter pinnipediorum subsp. pinnipediorum]|uniref:Selenide, water dikinase SelD n=1 Tax=Campylobacter pinnipediorum subsp. pinnipediorum TaxID=1660067 RepID=A0AAX0L8T2_9BACT|nr:selenide, water dikinase SelD [Campylobacter pinnipediorum subsp. pinnipediorum]